VIHTISFNELAAMCLDFVDHNDGFFYLRLVGTETVVNAIWARLSAREGRGKKWNSTVQITIPGRSYPEYVAAEKGVTYRTLRSRLPNGMVDLAMVHPRLTVAEDSPQGFYLLTYETGLPESFFTRLNRSLSIPLKPAWAPWLWELGQESHSRLTLVTRSGWDGGKPTEQTELTETTNLPVTRRSGLGSVGCYRVQCAGQYKAAWLQLIRQQLDLGIRLHPNGKQRYVADAWRVHRQGEAWLLFREEERLLTAPSLNYLLVEARETLGLHFIVTEETE
jgi:hypothetical protein